VSLTLYTHPACLQHDPGRGHPESPERLAAVIQVLLQAYPQLQWLEPPVASRSQLARVHTDALIADVLDMPIHGLRRLDADTAMSTRSPAAALHAAGAAIAAVDALVAGESRRAFCATRPPGHHATTDTAMGFCLFNNVAAAAAHALEQHGLARVAIADFDVHHGNGTQDIFAADPRVLYVSSHQSPLYPDSGKVDERGVGNIVNAPLPPRSGSAAFRAAWTQRLLPALDAFRPELLLISAGFDAHRLDPLADLNLEVDDYAWITQALCDLADRHAQGRVVSLLEGGYSLTALRECCMAHVGILMAAD
jgi:acetoin utilization deacetylase AcuC-like enzyme